MLSLRPAKEVLGHEIESFLSDSKEDGRDKCWLKEYSKEDSIPRSTFYSWSGWTCRFLGCLMMQPLARDEGESVFTLWNKKVISGSRLSILLSGEPWSQDPAEPPFTNRIWKRKSFVTVGKTWLVIRR